MFQFADDVRTNTTSNKHIFTVHQLNKNNLLGICSSINLWVIQNFKNSAEQMANSFTIHFDVDKSKFTVDSITIELILDAPEFMYTNTLNIDFSTNWNTEKCAT